MLIFPTSSFLMKIVFIWKIINVKTIDNKHFTVIASTDIRGEIFDFAVKTNNKILTIKEIERSMEEVFRSLTK